MLNKSQRKYENRWLAKNLQDLMNDEDENQPVTMIYELLRYITIRTDMLAQHTEQEQMNPVTLAAVVGSTMGEYLNEIDHINKNKECPVCLVNKMIQAFTETLMNNLDVDWDLYGDHGDEE